jgi:hypothetical protein
VSSVFKAIKINVKRRYIMAKLKKLESIVEKILEENKDARENDDILYLYVCEYFNEEAQTIADIVSDEKFVVTVKQFSQLIK